MNKDWFQLVDRDVHDYESWRRAPIVSVKVIREDKNTITFDFSGGGQATFNFDLLDNRHEHE